jgi:acyl carrier protein
MMEPIVATFTELVRTVPRAVPVRPWVSSLTGTLITDAQAIDPVYWAQQMRQPVRFMDGVGTLMDPTLVLLEVGPGQALASLARQHPGRKAEQLVVTSLHGGDFEADLDYLLAAVGRLWTAGVGIDWSAFHADSKRRRISLPTYPFERRRYWVMPAVATADFRPLATSTASPVSTPIEDAKSESTVPRPTANRTQVVKRLQTLFAELSGIDADALDPVVTFPELGLDSLFLTQAVGAIAKQFGARVTFRDLLEDYSTLNGLADRLVSITPTDPASAMPATDVGGEGLAPGGATTRMPAIPGASTEHAYPVHRAFFFGPSGRQIFANYHPPVRGSGEVLTVICPPLLLEHTRTQYALRKLAISLAESGQHVLRFDYRGTGDSFGDLEEVTVSDWVADVGLAVQEGLDVSGSQKVRLLGVRAGALLAASFAGSSDDVQRLVLWDPVPDGAAYLQGLRRVQATMLERHSRLSRHERREARQEYAGHGISKRMLEEFRLFNASAYSSVPIGKVRVVSTSGGKRFPVKAVSQDVVQLNCNWEMDSEDLIMPQPALLERLITCLTMP